MPSTKRKAPLDSVLQSRVQARRESSEEIESSDVGSSINGNDDIVARSEEVDNDDGANSNISSSSSSEPASDSELEVAPNSATSISFGALAKAQATLGTKSPKKPSANNDAWNDDEALERKAGRKDMRDFSRSSKHAPTEISSKKAVSRKRDVVPVAQRRARDPRFEAVTGYVEEDRIRRNYGFLDQYRDDEMKELKEGIRKAKDEETRQVLDRKLMSMQDRKRAQTKKDREKEMLDRHRKAEKELVKQGKNPFYLKKGEQKRRLLVEQFGELKGKKLDRTIERRRKKVEGKEKKKMPFARRTVGS